MRDLSVLIPARNEEWLNKTVSDVQGHSQADTEIIVVLDGAWPKEPLPQHPRVQVVYLPESIGQRAAVNLAARISTARYVMKLDAHCAVDDGFDVKLIQAAQALGEDVTQIPAMMNLHIFDRICRGCGRRDYQGPTDVECVACGKVDWDREIVWNPVRRRTEFWRLDHELKFQYFPEFKKRPEAQAEIVDVMTSIGACFFVSRERYWDLGGFDEAGGVWGQFGCEWALKSWLSGGRHVVNRRTWFSHCFRTQGHNFGFPYPLSGSEVDHARRYSREMWFQNAWPGQVRPLRWLVDKFAPVPGWTQEQIDALPQFVESRRAENAGRFDRGFAEEHSRTANTSHTAGIVYYSDNRPEEIILEAARRTIEQSGLPIVAVTLAPISWSSARNIVLPLERGYLTMFRQILAGLEALDTDVVFLAEHDLLYHPSHFEFRPPRDDAYFYNTNTWKVDVETGRAVTYETKQTSGLCASRLLLLAHYRERVRRVEAHGFSRRMGFEPGSHRRPERIDDIPSVSWTAAVPNIDLRHAANLTASRWSPEQFRDQRNCQGWIESCGVPGWGQTKGRMRELLEEVCHAAQQAVA